MSSEISNPFSTGGGGQFFEAKVQAGFLLRLLIEGRVPCLPTGLVQSVRLQAKQAGFRTDDVVVKVLTEVGTEHRLLAQIKHRASFAASDREFSDALENAWSDFSDERVFGQGRDALALITGPQSEQVLQHVRPLLDWARTSASGAEFYGKVATPEFSSDKKRAYLQVFRDVLNRATGNITPDETLWQFFKHFYLLTYDFDVQGGKDEADVLTVLDLARAPTSGLDAQAIWDGLITQAQEWNKTAGTFTRPDIPERLRSSVRAQRSTVQREAVSKLREHCDFVLGIISSELAPGIRLPRKSPLDMLANALESAKLVMVQGAPGCGKSAIVKMLFEALPNGITSLAFKAEEFNEPHIHQFLTSIGITLTAAQLRSEFALLPRKVVLVDGAERLFELSSLEAFRQLLAELRADPSWRVVITCREASAQSLTEHILAQWGEDVATVAIPPLSAEELVSVSRQVPQLAPLISNQRLARLLRLPFILSLAWRSLTAPPSAETAMNIDERQFKSMVWKNYVERATRTERGLPTKRSQCLISVSVARARRMSLFVSPEGLDAEALDALRDDGILLRSSAGNFAPAHDVLEDWGVSRFIEQQFEEKAGDPLRFVTAVGTEPAMRRGFRLWLSEALRAPRNPMVMDFVVAAFSQASVPPVWRDEIAVSVLESEAAGEFIGRNERLLLSDNKKLYRRLVHLLRTACKGPNESLLRVYGVATFRSLAALGSVFVVPVGNGWQELILFTYRNLAACDIQDTDVVLGLVKDWAQGLSSSGSLPTEAHAVAQICIKYWKLLTAPRVYGAGPEREFLSILFKIPHAAPDDVASLIRFAMATRQERNHHHLDTLLKQVTKSLECQALCTHFPDLVIEVAEKTWRSRIEDRERRYGMRVDLEEMFGFQHSIRFDYFPQSALQGPFMFLLASHPELAIDFILRLANEAAVSYSQSDLGDEVSMVHLPTDMGSRPLIASPRLWVMYRGMTAGASMLECSLMALEAWLLSQAKEGKPVRAVFRKILDNSSSAMTVAVLASVALAYSEAVHDEILPLLTIREFCEWDFQRSHQEQFAISDARPMLGLPTRGIDEIYYQERKESASLQHRRTNLQDLAFRLQWSPLRENIQAILDRFHAALPPGDEQSEADKTWRIALHRMDARHFTAEPGREPGQVILTPGEPAPDLQQHISQAAERLAPAQRRMQLVMWGMSQFRGVAQARDAFPDWRNAFREAQALSQQPGDSDEAFLDLSAPSVVASVIVRDHYSELAPGDYEWCRNIVIAEVLRADTKRTRESRIGRNSFAGSRPCAFVLPLLLQGDIEGQIRGEIEKCLAVAVTHTSEEVRDYAAGGVRTWLWDIDADLAKACVGGVFELSSIKNGIRKTERSRTEFSHEREETAIETATGELRARIVIRDTVRALAAPSVDLKTHDWPELLDALAMLRPGTEDLDLRALVMANLNAVLREAEAGEAWKSEERGQVSYEFQHGFAGPFAQFALASRSEGGAEISRLLRDSIERCPEYLAVLLQALIFEEDRVRSDAIFWGIWKNLSDPVFQHGLLRGSTRIWRYSAMHKLVRVLLFADVEWKDGVKEWAPLTARKEFVEQAAAAVGGTRAGFGALLSFFNSVGQVFLPDAITLLSEAVRGAGEADLLEDSNAVFELEILLRRVCYESGTRIRKRPEQHRAVLSLLDQLVERGSHTGFRLRDYIIAPLPAVS